jgi:hypothetical protein
MATSNVIHKMNLWLRTAKIKAQYVKGELWKIGRIDGGRISFSKNPLANKTMYKQAIKLEPPLKNTKVGQGTRKI